MSILTLYMTGICIYYIVQRWKSSNVSFAASLRSTPIGLVLAIVGFLGSLYPLVLFFAHLFFMCIGQSTHEFVCVFRILLIVSNNLLAEIQKSQKESIQFWECL